MSVCGSARETASESLRDELRWHYTHQAQRQLWWIGFVSSFFPAITHSARAATAPQKRENESLFRGLLKCFCSLILVQMNSVFIPVQCFKPKLHDECVK